MKRKIFLAATTLLSGMFSYAYAADDIKNSHHLPGINIVNHLEDNSDNYVEIFEAPSFYDIRNVSLDYIEKIPDACYLTIYNHLGQPVKLTKMSSYVADKSPLIMYPLRDTHKLAEFHCNNKAIGTMRDLPFNLTYKKDSYHENPVKTKANVVIEKKDVGLYYMDVGEDSNGFVLKPIFSFTYGNYAKYQSGNITKQINNGDKITISKRDIAGNLTHSIQVYNSSGSVIKEYDLNKLLKESNMISVEKYLKDHNINLEYGIKDGDMDIYKIKSYRPELMVRLMSETGQELQDKTVRIVTGNASFKAKNGENGELLGETFGHTDNKFNENIKVLLNWENSRNDALLTTETFMEIKPDSLQIAKSVEQTLKTVHNGNVYLWKDGTHCITGLKYDIDTREFKSNNEWSNIRFYFTDKHTPVCS